MATPTLHVEDELSRELIVRIYGDGSLPCTLYEDDGVTLDAPRSGDWNLVTLVWNAESEHISILRHHRSGRAYRYSGGLGSNRSVCWRSGVEARCTGSLSHTGP